ncbi:MAG TPA: hypothetical protein DIT54_08225 [Lachnospiraceae bacterium]|nr:hypothetical protein [Lachnospiraceae bacterium]
MDQSEKKTISYHTFYFSFTWDTKDKKIEFEKLVKKLNESNVWKYDNLENRHISAEEIRWRFQAYQYFHEPVRKAILGDINQDNNISSSVVRNFKYKDLKKGEAKYYIEKNDKKYQLFLNDIRLKIFNSNVGILIFECENQEYDNLQDIKAINEYGRRVITPFLPIEEQGFQLCADKITVQIADGISFETDFKNIFKYEEHLSIKKGLFQYIASFITQILSSENLKFTSYFDEQYEEDQIVIKSALDDRMYVCCLARSQQLANEAKKLQILSNKKEIEINDDEKNILKNIYELAFIDTDDGDSCPTLARKIQILKKQVYDRWLEYGTAYVVTHHSFLCITSDSEGIDLSVILPYLIIYSEMAALCLAQRASIILFQRELAKVTKNMGEIKKLELFRRRKWNEKALIRLQEKYIAFRSQIMFFEVTSQEQGVELYDMLRESLYIEREKENLDTQMGIAYEAATIRQGNKWTHWSVLIALLSFIVAIMALILEIIKC